MLQQVAIVKMKKNSDCDSIEQQKDITDMFELNELRYK